MNPLRIRCANYRSFRDLDLTLPTGTLAILGANGAGKSSVVNAIELALFGPPSRNLGDYLSDDATDDLMVELEFEHRGGLYRARRSYSAGGRGSAKLDFEQARTEIGGAPDAPTHWEGWEPMTRETAAATQQLIEDTIGLSRATFRASAFLAQGDGAAFTEASPRDRKSILAECVGLAQWDVLH
ncbi:MAG: SMC family ATPase, partial [Actinomycetota bacterium]|nr:SMC family ATPase [Actinomycetota bacterium]